MPTATESNWDLTEKDKSKHNQHHSFPCPKQHKTTTFYESIKNKTKRKEKQSTLPLTVLKLPLEKGLASDALTTLALAGVLVLVLSRAPCEPSRLPGITAVATGTRT